MRMLAHILGWLGTALVVWAYFLISFKKISADNRNYQWLSLIGSIGLGVNVYYNQAWPALALEVVWGTIALAALAKKAPAGT